MKNKLLSLILAACIILSAIPMLGVTAFAADNAPATLTAEDITNAIANKGTIVINNKADWLVFSTAAPDNNYAGVTVKLGADIVVNEGFDPAKVAGMTTAEISALTVTSSKVANQFQGTFDGQDHTIEGLYMTGGYLFAHNHGTVKDVTFKNCYSKSTGSRTAIIAEAMRNANAVVENVDMVNCYVINGANNGAAAGFIVMPFAGTIRNCSFSGMVEAAVGTGAIAGAFVGNFANDGTTYIQNCVNTGTIKSATTGGIVGEHRGTKNVEITGCVNRGAVIGNNIGGIIGIVACTVAGPDVKIENCENYGAVQGTGVTGGIVGFPTKKGTLEVIGCTNYGKITSANGYGTGGIVGYSADTGATTLTDCVNNGEINGYNAGGIAGNINSLNFSIIGCVSNGTVTGSNRTGGMVGHVTQGFSVTGGVVNATIVGGENTGGFIGYTGGNHNFTSCAFLGNVSSTAQNVGGFIGAVTGGTSTFTNCLSNGTVTAIAGRSAAAFVGFQGGTRVLNTCLVIGDYRNADTGTLTNYKSYTAAEASAMSAGEMMRALWSAGFDFNNNWSMTADGAIPTAAFNGTKATPDATKDIVYKGCQLGLDNTAEAGNVRFIAGMQTIEGYMATGFEIIAIDANGTHAGDAEGNPLAINDTVVYESLMANGVANAIKATDLNCVYLSAVTVTGLSDNAVVELTATLTKLDGTVVRGTTVMIVLENGNVVAQYAI